MLTARWVAHRLNKLAEKFLPGIAPPRWRIAPQFRQKRKSCIWRCIFQPCRPRDVNDIAFRPLSPPPADESHPDFCPRLICPHITLPSWRSSTSERFCPAQRPTLTGIPHPPAARKTNQFEWAKPPSSVPSIHCPVKRWRGWLRDGGKALGP